MVRSVRERLEALRPVRAASACRESGRVAAITLRRARFLFESTLAKLSGDVNQTLGSSFDGLRRPRAIAIVRFFMSSKVAMPTFSVFIWSLSSRASSDGSRHAGLSLSHHDKQLPLQGERKRSERFAPAVGRARSIAEACVCG